MTDARANSAVGAGDDPLATDEVNEPLQALGDQARVFDDVSGVADDTRHEQHVVRQPGVFPYLPLVLVPRIGGFERDAGGGYLEDEVHNVLELDIVGMRPVP